MSERRGPRGRRARAVGGAQRAVLFGRQVVLGAEGGGLEPQPHLPVAVLEQGGAAPKHRPGVRVPAEPVQGLSERVERIGAPPGFTNILQSLLEASQRGGLARRSLSKAEIDENSGGGSAASAASRALRR